MEGSTTICILQRLLVGVVYSEKFMQGNLYTHDLLCVVNEEVHAKSSYVWCPVYVCVCCCRAVFITNGTVYYIAIENVDFYV